MFKYTGERRIERSDKVATEAGGGETHVCYREDYDAFGRLVSVAENLASNGAGDCSPGATGLVTTYAYDEADRLSGVCATGGTAGCDQERFFTYDGRGFLTSEQHPEIGPGGNGIASYTYDASGNVLSKDISGTSDFALRYAYDPANRLITVDEVDGPDSTRPIKSFHYARGNDGTDLRAGKLVLSKRTNWVDIIGPLVNPEVTGTLPVVISQAYRYQGLDGRVSRRQTRYRFDAGNFAFETGFAYDQLGNLSQLEYPRCLHGSCADLDPPRTIDFGHTRGFLSSVTGFASLTYQQGGMLHQVIHANGVVETIDVDPLYPFERPHSITTTGVTPADWNSGVYEYDGSGNVRKIGTSVYRYDRMSRLLSGQVQVGGATKAQSLSYDAFGNILALTTDGVTLTT
ncbi:MAG: RHS repeat protein, partial [Actinomycetia bacterium]|nr:RHS repeat protein [Actinomycetes bacterium]